MDWTYFHLMTNHAPVLGAIFGTIILLWGKIRRSRQVLDVGLALMVFTGLMAIPVYLTGEPAEHAVEGLPGVLEQFIESHEDFAQYALISAIISGIAALAALVLGLMKSDSRVRGLLATVTIVLALITAGLMGWTARLGGLIRHSEIRAAGTESPAPPRGESRRESRDDDDH